MTRPNYMNPSSSVTFVLSKLSRYDHFQYLHFYPLFLVQTIIISYLGSHNSLLIIAIFPSSHISRMWLLRMLCIIVMINWNFTFVDTRFLFNLIFCSSPLLILFLTHTGQSFCYLNIQICYFHKAFEGIFPLCLELSLPHTYIFVCRTSLLQLFVQMSLPQRSLPWFLSKMSYYTLTP